MDYNNDQVGDCKNKLIIILFPIMWSYINYFLLEYCYYLIYLITN